MGQELAPRSDFYDNYGDRYFLLSVNHITLGRTSNPGGLPPNYLFSIP